MKKLKTRSLCLLLCAILLVSIAGCGSKNVAVSDLSALTIQSDVQEYITTFIDPTAKITSFSQEKNQISDTETEVVCNTAYAGEESTGSGEFTLTYMLENGSWVLNGCQVNLADIAPVEQTAAQESQEPAAADSAGDEIVIPTIAPAAPASSLESGEEDDLSLPTIAPASPVPSLEVYAPPEDTGSDVLLSELYEIYSFKLEGKTYTIPVQASELLNNGWYFQYGHDASTKLTAMSYTSERIGETSNSADPDQRNSFLVDLYNPTEEEIATSDGYVARVHYEKATDDRGELSFETSKGIKIGSTRDEVLSAYGNDTWTSSDTEISYKYLNDQDFSFTSNSNGKDKLTFRFDEDGKVKEIEMELVLFLD